MTKLSFSIFLVVIICVLTANAQSKEELKKKYENSDLFKETEKKLQTAKIYPDSIILAPLHYTNSFYKLDTITNDFQSISIDVTIENTIPDHYSFYISPFNIDLNGIPLYCGIQTSGGGINIKTGKDEHIKYNGIFSRWYERTKEALKTEGCYASSDDEGDFISVRNFVGWNKGTYRITLKKEDYIPGHTIPDSLSSKETYFSWGDYEHTWVTLYVEDLSTNKITNIGSLAFPGKKIKMANYNTSFTEQYKCVIDFSSKLRDNSWLHYSSIPNVKVIQSNLQINGKAVIPKSVNTIHNNTHHPDQDTINGKMPILSTDKYNTQTGELTLETGKFVGWAEN